MEIGTFISTLSVCYEIQGEMLTKDISISDSSLKTGDTVDIKYSNEKPEVSIIADDVYSFASKKKAVLALLAVSIFIILITGFYFWVM